MHDVFEQCLGLEAAVRLECFEADGFNNARLFLMGASQWRPMVSDGG